MNMWDYENTAFAKEIRKETVGFSPKIERLKNMELFVLDNTMRETTVATLRAHTVESKRAILKTIKKCGFKYYIVESFNSETRMGDLFLQDLIEKGEDLSGAFAFSELWEKIEDKIPQPDIPIGLKKCKQYGINHVMLEFDLMYYKIDYDLFDMDKVCNYLKNKIDWIRENLSRDSLILINIRDFSQTMLLEPDSVQDLVNFLGSLPSEERILGICFEDLGKVLPEQLGVWTGAVRHEMDRCGWTEGQLLFHQHEQWGMMHAANLEVLGRGATGMWAAVCIEGAAMGHADTTTAIMNLVRLGNEKVLKQYNCKYLRKAAIKITKLVTGKEPYQKQPIYGERAIDLVFGFLFSDPYAKTFFNMAEFLGIEKTVRISNMANAEMVKMKLVNVFGEDPQFTIEMAQAMKAQMLENAKNERKEEYNSKVGLAVLFDQSGGQLTPAMTDSIVKAYKVSKHIDGLIDEIKAQWDAGDNRDGEKDGRLKFEDFYNGFMGAYFGCYRCEDSQRGLRCIDMDDDGFIDWNEFKLYLIWAGRQYHNVNTAEDLMDKAFRYGIIPAMNDERDALKENKKETKETEQKKKRRGRKNKNKKGENNGH